MLSTTRERGINADKKGIDLDVRLCGRRQGVTFRLNSFTGSSSRVHRTSTPVLNSCDTVSRQEDLVDDLLFKSGNRVEFLRLSSSETCQCAKHCTLDFGDFGVLPSVHQCDLDASRVVLRLGCCVLLTEECDQRGILQHLLSALLLLLSGVVGAASSNCSIEGVLTVATMTCVNGSTELNWLAPGSSSSMQPASVRVRMCTCFFCCPQLTCASWGVRELDNTSAANKKATPSKCHPHASGTA